MSLYGLVVCFFLIYRKQFWGVESHFNNLFYLKLFYSNTFVNCVVFFNVHKLFIAQFWKALSQIPKKQQIGKRKTDVKQNVSLRRFHLRRFSNQAAVGIRLPSWFLG